MDKSPTHTDNTGIISNNVLNQLKLDMKTYYRNSLKQATSTLLLMLLTVIGSIIPVLFIFDFEGIKRSPHVSMVLLTLLYGLIAHQEFIRWFTLAKIFKRIDNLMLNSKDFVTIEDTDHTKVISYNTELYEAIKEITKGRLGELELIKQGYLMVTTS